MPTSADVRLIYIQKYYNLIRVCAKGHSKVAGPIARFYNSRARFASQVAINSCSRSTSTFTRRGSAYLTGLKMTRPAIMRPRDLPRVLRLGIALRLTGVKVGEFEMPEYVVSVGEMRLWCPR